MRRRAEDDVPGTWSVTCPCCRRTERWSAAGARDVVSPGGARRPAVHPTLDAWRTLRRSLDGELGPVVGACAACGQPLAADNPGCPLPRTPWTLELPDGTLTVTDHVEAPGGPMDLDAAEARVEAHTVQGLLEGFSPGLALFQASLLTVMMVPVALWLVGVFVVWLFLTNYYR